MQTTDDDQTDAQHPEEALAPSRRPATLRRARAPTRGMAAAARQDVFSGGTAGGFLAFLQKREDVAEAVRVAVSANLLDAKQDRPGWRGMMAVPPGSGIERVLSAFRSETDIPLEVPFFSFIHFVSGWLMSKGVLLDGPMGEMSPELWTIVLAGSGAGKTWAAEAVEAAAPVKSNFAQPASAKAMLDNFTQPWCLWTQDEIAQILKQIEKSDGPLGAEAKEYLLRAYSNSSITRKTAKDTITVERPVLGILGLNTPESFRKALSAESLLDGFAQRFGFVWAKDDPGRPFQDYAIYDKKSIVRICQQAFDDIAKVPFHERYTIGPEAKLAFETSFGLLAKGFENSKSYFRRAIYRAFKYALIYHVMLRKTSQDIDAEDIGWGARAVSLHLADMNKVLGNAENGGTQFKQLASNVERVKKWVERRTAAGIETKPRDLKNGLRGFKDTQEAATMLELVLGRQADNA